MLGTNERQSDINSLRVWPSERMESDNGKRRTRREGMAPLGIAEFGMGKAPCGVRSGRLGKSSSRSVVELDGAEQASAERQRERHVREACRRVQVVLARLVNHAPLSMRLGVCIGDGHVELAGFEGYLVTRVVQTENELTASARHAGATPGRGSA